jgi:hypothetical protein
MARVEQQKDARPLFRWLAGLTAPVFLITAFIAWFPGLVNLEEEPSFFMGAIMAWGAVVFTSIAATGKLKRIDAEQRGRQHKLFAAASRYAAGEMTLEEYGTITQRLLEGGGEWRRLALEGKKLEACKLYKEETGRSLNPTWIRRLPIPSGVVVQRAFTTLVSSIAKYVCVLATVKMRGLQDHWWRFQRSAAQLLRQPDVLTVSCSICDSVVPDWKQRNGGARLRLIVPSYHWALSWLVGPADMKRWARRWRIPPAICINANSQRLDNPTRVGFDANLLR